MKQDEVILIKAYDSDRMSKARFAPHAAFNHPDSKPTDPERVSIGARGRQLLRVGASPVLPDGNRAWAEGRPCFLNGKGGKGWSRCRREVACAAR